MKSSFTIVENLFLHIESLPEQSVNSTFFILLYNSHNNLQHPVKLKHPLFSICVPKSSTCVPCSHYPLSEDTHVPESYFQDISSVKTCLIPLMQNLLSLHDVYAFYSALQRFGVELFMCLSLQMKNKSPKDNNNVLVITESETFPNKYLQYYTM